jgi:hypothetical protein
VDLAPVTELKARLRPEPPSWDDDLPDAIALVECVLGDDLTGAGSILRNMSPGPVAVVLAKLCAHLVREADEVTGIRWRQFAEWAVRQP